MSNEIDGLRREIRKLRWCVWALGIGLLLAFSVLDIKTDVIQLHLDGYLPIYPAHETRPPHEPDILLLPLQTSG